MTSCFSKIHRRRSRQKMQRNEKSLYYLLCTQAVECKAPVTANKIEEWEMRNTLIFLSFFFSLRTNKVSVVNRRMHFKQKPWSCRVSKCPLTGAVRINSWGNSRGVPSFFPQSQKTAMLFFLFQKQAPFCWTEREKKPNSHNKFH